MVAMDETEGVGEQSAVPPGIDQEKRKKKSQLLEVYLSRSYVKGPGNMASWRLYNRNYQRCKGPMPTQSHFLKLLSMSHHCEYLKHWTFTHNRQSQLVRVAV